MNDRVTVDARGLSCPMPAAMARDAIRKAGRGTVEVLLDSATSCDNVERIARMNGWSVETSKEGKEQIRVVLRR